MVYHAKRMFVALAVSALLFIINVTTIVSIQNSNEALGDLLLERNGYSRETVDFYVRLAEYRERKAYRALWSFDAFVVVSGFMFMASLGRGERQSTK